MKKVILFLLVAVVSLAALAIPVRSQEESPGFRNLQVLPKDISRRDLGRVMQNNLRGLGLPRRQSEGCLYCHVGDMETPVEKWDFASDAKPEKIKARAMMAMVASINSDHLKALPNRTAPQLEVRCSTCHAGRTLPMPLSLVLMDAYREAGIEKMIAEYRELRGRYFGSNAYDFRVDTLNRLANRLAGQGAFDDAIALAGVNSEVFPEDPETRQAVVFIGLQRTTVTQGIDAALAEFDRPRDVRKRR